MRIKYSKKHLLCILIKVKKHYKDSYFGGVFFNITSFEGDVLNIYLHNIIMKHIFSS
jgi:hypothetical protein